MKSRKLTAISSLLSGVVAAALLATTFTTGGGTAYASQVADIGGTAASGIQVQNLESQPASLIQLKLYPQGGGAALTPLNRPNVGGESSANFYMPTEQGVANGAYGAVLSADRQIAAIARTEWTSGGRGGAATYGSVAPAQNVILPLVLGPTAAAPLGFAGQISEFSVQNAAETGTANVTIEIFGTGQSTAVKTHQDTISAGTSKTYKMGTTAPFVGLQDTQLTPKGFVGYARISSSSAANPLVVQSYVDFPASLKAVYAFSGVAESSKAGTLYAPLLRRDYFGTTGVSLVNPNNEAANVLVTYYNDPQSPQKLGAANTETVSVPANSSVVLYQGPRAGQVLPDPDANAGRISNNNGWFGAAKFVSNQPILAVVNDAVINDAYATQTSAAYNAATSAEGATKIFAPLARRRHVGQLLTTGIQVQNVGTDPTTITVAYKNSSGAALGQQTTANVAPGASVNFYQDGPGTPFPAGQFGSAVITSTGQPLALIVNDFSLNNTLDAALYNGLK